ncbi:MAG: insulinase family protein [Paucibacter sp.]|nr:insulinase family protein [Roseateles sp.]
MKLHRLLSLSLCAGLLASGTQADPVSTRPVKPAKAAPAASKAAPVQPGFVRELGGISEYRLPNGLQILLFPDAAQSTTTVNVTYRVGSRFEGQGEYGMAHLLEHLMFKGTPTHKDIPTEFAQHALRFNGTTNTDRTNYFESFNADDKTLAYAIGMEADRMVHSNIARADLDKEMSVVRNEYERGENEPFAVLMKRVQSAAYEWHAYGHATIGPKSDIENVPIEKLQAFYRTYYRPDNATLLVAGRFDPQATLQLIAKDFGPVANPLAPIPVPYTVEPAQDGERSVVVRRVGGQPILLVSYHVPAQAHPDTPALLVYSSLMSLQPSGHIYKQLVETKQAVDAGLVGLGGHDPGSAMAYAVLPADAKPEDIDAVQKKLTGLVEDSAATPDTPFTEDELKRVRDLAVLQYRNAMKRPEALIGQISSLLGAGDWRLMFQLMEDIPKVTLADVERVRHAYFKAANSTVGRYLPTTEVERVTIPETPALAERLAALKAPPKVEEGEQFDPTPAHLDERTKVQTLPSGIELSTLSKKTRGNTVTLLMNLRWGEARATTLALGTDAVDDMLMEGSEHYDRQKIRDELVRLKATASVSGGNQGATLVISAERDTLLDALALMADVMQHPLFPADAFDRIKKGGLAGLEASREQLGTKRQEAVRGLYNSGRGVKFGDPDYIPSLDERIDELRRTQLGDVRDFYTRYWSADATRVAVVGALPDGLAAAVEKDFGAWKKADAPRFVRHVSTAFELPVQRVDVEAKDKTSAEATWAERLVLSEQDADYLPLALAVRVFGSGGMESRLSTRVRRNDGMTYGIGARMAAPWFGNDADLYISATFAPQNREAVIAAVHEELLRMSQDGITAEELARAKHDILEAWRQARASDGALAGSLNQHLDIGHRDWVYTAQRDAALQAVTLEQANAAWRKYIRPDGFLLSTAGDFAGQATKAKN